MNRTDAALARFAQGHNCCQAVLCTFADQLGVDEPTAFRLAAGFGGGMGRMAETCGAVSGAMMVLGLRQVSTPGDRDARNHVYGQVREFAERFRQRHASLICRELLGCDISTPEGLQQATREKMFSTLCPKFVADAVEILEQMAAEAANP